MHIARDNMYSPLSLTCILNVSFRQDSYPNIIVHVRMSRLARLWGELAYLSPEELALQGVPSCSPCEIALQVTMPGWISGYEVLYNKLDKVSGPWIIGKRKNFKTPKGKKLFQLSSSLQTLQRGWLIRMWWKLKVKLWENEVIRL